MGRRADWRRIAGLRAVAFGVAGGIGLPLSVNSLIEGGADRAAIPSLRERDGPLMLRWSPVRRLLWPGLTTAAMLALAVGLGIWQIQRLSWKTALLAEIDRGEAAAAIPLPEHPQPFTKIRVEGLLRQDLAALYGIEVRTNQSGPVLGAFLLNPLERPGADPIIVDRGWVPTDAPRETTPVRATIEGYVRPPEQPVRFGAADDPAARRFYALDPAAIGASLGLRQVAPFTLVALGEAPRGVYPEPAQALPRPANNHFVYALTWFGLAAALLAVFGVYARKLLKSHQ